jgi:hypothetical protein
MIDDEVIEAAICWDAAGRTVGEWVVDLQAKTKSNAAFDKWEAAANVAQDVIEAGGDWELLLERLENKAER